MAKTLSDEKGVSVIQVSMADLENEKSIMKIILGNFEQAIANWISKDEVKKMLKRLTDIIRDHYNRTPFRKRCTPEAITVTVERDFWTKVQAIC